MAAGVEPSGAITRLPSVTGPVVAAILRHMLRATGPVSRSDIARKLNISMATVSKATKALVREGVFVEDEARALSGPGHPVLPLRWSDKHLTVGIKIVDRDGLPHRLFGAVTTLDGRRIGDDNARLSRVSPTADPEGSAGHLVAEIVEFFHSLRNTFIGADQRVIGLGIDVGGHVHNGHVVFSVNTGWGLHKGARPGLPTGITLRESLEEKLELAVVIDNDVTALTVLEHLLSRRSLTATWGTPDSAETAALADEDLDSFVLITIYGDGVGGGLVVHGKPWRGAFGMAGEAGHIPIGNRLFPPPAGEEQPIAHKCRCGRYGCLEAYISSAAILTQLPSADSLRGAVRLPESDEAARDVFTAAGRALGLVVAGLINFVNPKTFILYMPPEYSQIPPGSAGYLFLENFNETVQESCFSNAATSTRFIFRYLSQWQLDELGARAAGQLVVDQQIRGYEEGTAGKDSRTQK